MCGIFGAVIPSGLEKKGIDLLITHAQQRGSDSSGLIILDHGRYSVARADERITRLLRRHPIGNAPAFFGHSRLITNGTADNQPVYRDGILVLHNGIIVNHEDLWTTTDAERGLEIDSEIIPALLAERLADGDDLPDAARYVIERTIGIVACAAIVPALGKAVLFSNNGSLYTGELDGGVVFSSESYPLSQLGCTSIAQVFEPVVIEIADSDYPVDVKDYRSRTVDLVPALNLSHAEEALLEFEMPDLRRCTRCILPDTMPFISFDAEGVCNYCAHYKPRNRPRPREELLKIIEPYRRASGSEVIVPFSGGRDSCYGLHLIVKELDLKPITYTYDWGMVTDLGRRNISRMSSELGVENIIVAADITKKRDHIRRNLRAWLKAPNLGMLSALTAGDKHFFRYIESVKRQTGVDLNLWGINPLEVTHFKSGFLGVAPDFAEQRVYSHGAMKQLRYQSLRFRAMAKSPGYFNRSLWDTLSGEYFRSFHKKSDYFHIFDYWKWDETEIDSTLENQYQWERATDTPTTWRIGDGTAAFYNYANFTIAGFTEHDTFRSNQIREGDLTRDEALALVEMENRPRYPNLRWYLDTLGMDFSATVRTVNATERLYAR